MSLPSWPFTTRLLSIQRAVLPGSTTYEVHTCFQSRQASLYGIIPCIKRQRRKRKGMAARGVSRPKLIGLFVLALALWPVVVGCAAEQEEEGGGGQEESAEEPLTGAFVGDDVSVIDDNSKAGAFLALVAEEPAE